MNGERAGSLQENKDPKEADAIFPRELPIGAKDPACSSELQDKKSFAPENTGGGRGGTETSAPLVPSVAKLTAENGVGANKSARDIPSGRQYCEQDKTSVSLASGGVGRSDGGAKEYGVSGSKGGE